MRSLTFALLALIVFASCARLQACAGGTLAEVIEAKGRVERDFAARARRSGKRRPSARRCSAVTDCVPGAESSALLRVGRNGRLRVESNATIRICSGGRFDEGRFARYPRREAAIAVLEAGDTTLPIRTSFGTRRAAARLARAAQPRRAGRALSSGDGWRRVRAGRRQDRTAACRTEHHGRHRNGGAR